MQNSCRVTLGGIWFKTSSAAHSRGERLAKRTRSRMDKSILKMAGEIDKKQNRWGTIYKMSSDKVEHSLLMNATTKHEDQFGIEKIYIFCDNWHLIEFNAFNK